MVIKDWPDSDWLDWAVTPAREKERLAVRDGGFVYAKGELFRAEVTTRLPERDVQPQGRMALYQIALCQIWSPGGGEAIAYETRPITVRALVLHEVRRLLVRYSLSQQLRRYARHALSDEVALRIEPQLGALAQQALCQAGVRVGDHALEAQWMHLAGDHTLMPQQADQPK